MKGDRIDNAKGQSERIELYLKGLADDHNAARMYIYLWKLIDEEKECTVTNAE